MRANGLLVIGALLNFAHANVVICQTNKLSAEPGLSGSEVASGLGGQPALAAIGHLCNNIKTENFVAHQLELTLFTVTRTGAAFSTRDFEGQFNAIIDKCIVDQNSRGGTIITNGLLYEVNNGIPPVPSGAAGSMSRRTIAKAAKNPTKPKTPTVKKPAPKDPVPKKPAPERLPSKQPTPKSCPMKKPGAKKPAQTPAKKTTRDFFLRLVRKLIPRASPTPSQLSEAEEAAYRCEDEPMAAPAGWGETFFGFYKENPNRRISKATVRNMAKQKYQEVMTLTNDVTIVAALYIPGDGIYFGTIAHGAGEAKFASTATSKAPKLWSKMGNRKPVKETKKGETPPSLYHAEDVAMYNYESKNLRVTASQRYPFGSFIAAYGRKRNLKNGALTAPGLVDPCSDDDARVTPTCMSTLNSLTVAFQ
ncbi:hypothetical protein EKO04_000983 [Ascochyta lentis]|uniref:Uncharacterized protein n=1 Tax=Ascochyta lentis TaxID=205686 RepID=A0A8H7JCS1_9PLEO|nr:hypothetical protein EKO04_000983 [Ascochyta lentis]